MKIKKVLCRVVGHDLWALAYPPARRWECHRCTQIFEEASTIKLKVNSKLSLEDKT